MIQFSIIIPLYNKENFIVDALKSVINQTFTAFEIIIVNDCSTDLSAEKVIPFITENVKLINHQENYGLSATRNTGIKNANYDYITFLDADDLWKPHFLETIHTLINTFTEAKIYATNYQEIYNSKTIIPKNGTQHLDKNSIQIINFFKHNLQQGIYNHGSVCFNKIVFETIGNYDETIDFAEDIDFNIRANSSFKLAYANTIGMVYRMQTGNQLTTSSIANKTVPDYDKYKVLAHQNNDFINYLDFEKYVLAKHLKTDGNYKLYKKISATIDYKNLNFKQFILLKMPSFFLKMIVKFKIYFIKKGMKFTSYS